MVAATPQLVFLAIRAAIRLGGVAREAYQNDVLDDDLVLGDIIAFTVTAAETATQLVDDTQVLREDPGLVALVNQFKDADDHQREQLGPALIGDLKSRFPEHCHVLDQEEITIGLNVLAQWKPGDEPGTPWDRLGIALADLVLEYVAADPSIFKLGTNGEKLVSSLASNLRHVLPDPDAGDDALNQFQADSLRIFAAAGLRTLAQNVDVVVEEKHFADLAKSVLTPLAEEFAKSDAGRADWYRIRDVMLGPVAEGAIGSLLRNQRAFLGGTFDPSIAMGAVTRSVLTSIHEDGLIDDLGEDGLKRIYQAALDVAVQQPELFLRPADGGADDVGRALLSDMAKALKEAPPPFTKALAGDLIVVAFETLALNVPALVTDQGDWADLTRSALKHTLAEVAAGLKQGLAHGQEVGDNLLNRLFTQQQAVAYVKIFMDQAAKTPGMIVGDDTSLELRNLITTVTAAIAAHDRLLLTTEDWLTVAATVAERAAAAPNRLIKIDATEPEQQLAYKIISALLTAASRDFKGLKPDGSEPADMLSPLRRRGGVLFGTNLVAAIEATIKAAAGNVDRAASPESLEAIDTLVVRLNVLVQKHPGRAGDREWMFLFRRFIAGALDEGEVPEHTDEELIAMLYATPGSEEATR